MTSSPSPGSRHRFFDVDARLNNVVQPNVVSAPSNVLFQIGGYLDVWCYRLHLQYHCDADCYRLRVRPSGAIACDQGTITFGHCM